MRALFLTLFLLIAALIASVVYFSPSSSLATHSTSVTAVISGDTNIFNTGSGGASANDCGTLFGVISLTCSGNFYVFDEDANSPFGSQFDPVNASTAAMRMGPIDECIVFPWTDATPGAGNSIMLVDIVIEDVTDMTGYQIRINFDSSLVTFLGPHDLSDDTHNGFLPFVDVQNRGSGPRVNFVNLPVEDQTNGHRSNNDATTTGTGTALLGDTYGGTRTTALSPMPGSRA